MTTMSTTNANIILLFCAAALGNAQDAERLMAAIYDDLKRLAASQLRGERPGHTLNPTALVHEAYIRLVGQQSGGYTGRSEFFGVAAQAMRRILVDRARVRLAAKRGGPEAVRVPLDDAVDRFEQSATDLVALDEALDSLERQDATKRQLVELRFFAGLDMKDVADIMGLSLRSAEREWALARAWLRSRVQALEGGPAPP